MDLRKRLFRKPLQTILWQIILIAMALLIGVGSVLLYSSRRLPHILDEQHTTVAVQKAKVEKLEDGSLVRSPTGLFPEDLETLRNMDMVKSIDLRTLTGAYVPELSARIGLASWSDLYQMNVDEMSSWHANDSYDKIVFAGTVEEIWSRSAECTRDYDLSAIGKPKFAEGATYCALMNIDQILVAQEDYYFFPNETYKEYNGKIIVEIPVFQAEGDENFFEVGSSYVVRGRYDPSAALRSTDLPGIPYTPRLSASMLTLNNTHYCFNDGMRLYAYEEYESETIPGPVAGYPSQKDIERCTKIGGDEIVVAQKIETTVEDLISQEPWSDIISLYEKTLHSFPVLGTEKLESMYVFLKSEASIVEGTTFTKEDYEKGNRVCIISESVANAAGVRVGDTVTFNQFQVPKNYEEGNAILEQFVNMGTVNNPAIGFNPIPFGLATENESFTVSGIYRLQNEWENSSFSITPNTIFIPQKAQLKGGFGGPSITQEEIRTFYKHTEGSDETETVTEPVSVTIDNGVLGVYMSIILENGQMDAFMKAIQDTPYAQREFLVFDQGYEAAKENIQAIVKSAEKLFMSAAAGWLLLLAVYILLYQSRQRRNLGIMRSVGAKPSQARRYLFASGAAPAAVGITVGTLLSGTVAKLVEDKLVTLTLKQAQSSAHSGAMAMDTRQLSAMLAESTIPLSALLVLAVLQIAVVVALLWLHAAYLSRKNTRTLLGV